MSAEAAEPQMPQLTPDQAKLIQDTWKLVAEDLEGAGMVMFMKLFEIAPELQELFSFKDEDVSLTNKKLKKHAVQVMESVGGAIAIIDKPGDLEEALLDLGIVHHMKNVKVESFAPVGQALVYALSQGLGELFTQEVQDAYVTFYGFVQYCMEKGMHEGLDA